MSEFKCLVCEDKLMVTVEKTDSETGEKFNTRIDCPQCTRRNVQPEQPPEGFRKLHPFLSAKLYERCHICKGTKAVKIGSKQDGMPCPECSRADNDHAGFLEIGVTVGQFERIMAERDLLVKALCRFEIEQEMMMADERSDLIAETLAKINSSSKTVARMEINREDRPSKPATTGQPEIPPEPPGSSS